MAHAQKVIDWPTTDRITTLLQHSLNTSTHNDKLSNLSLAVTHIKQIERTVRHTHTYANTLITPCKAYCKWITKNTKESLRKGSWLRTKGIPKALLYAGRVQTGIQFFKTLAEYMAYI